MTTDPGNAPATLEAVHALAQHWAGYAPDDFADTPEHAVLARAGRDLLRVLGAETPPDRLSALAAAQGVKPVESVDEVLAWPGEPIPEDELDAFLAAIHGDDEGKPCDA